MNESLPENWIIPQEQRPSVEPLFVQQEQEAGRIAHTLEARQDISIEVKSHARRLLDRVKSLARIGMTAIILIQPGTLFAQEVKRGASETAEVKDLSQDSARLFNFSEIRDSVMNDSHERVFVSFNDGKEYFEGSLNQSLMGVQFSFNTIIERARKEGVQNIVYGHTHPLSAVSLFSVEASKENDGSRLMAIPPSTPDIFIHASVDERAGHSDLTASGVVFGTSGEWRYAFNRGAPELKELRQYLKECGEKLADVEDCLPLEMFRDVGNMNDPNVLLMVGDTPEADLEKVDVAVKQIIQKFPRISRVLVSLNATHFRIMNELTEHTPDDPKMKVLIERWIAHASELGLNATYTPYTK